MQKVQSVSIAQRSVLAEYAQVRWQLVCLEAKRRELESLATEEAMTVVAERRAANGAGGRIVYRDRTCDITLQFRTDKPKPEGNGELEFLQEMIEIEGKKATQLNAQSISQLMQIKAMIEAMLTQLQQTDAGRDYEQEYQFLLAQLTTQKPILSVKLKSNN